MRRSRLCRRIGAAIDVLVNNAGLSRGLTKLYEDDPENWDEMIDTNVKGLLAVTRAVVPGMVARERWARHQPGLDRWAHDVREWGGLLRDEGSREGHQRGSQDRSDGHCGAGHVGRSGDGGDGVQPVRFRGDEERAAKVYEKITPLKPEDIADAIVWAASRPAHVNIHTIVLTTIDQANSTVFHRHG